ncbi:hypothetical protein JK222_15035 [Gluconobacter cerinus]|nr:hypothetical protein [Gluconobacter cerinus]
MVSDDFEKMVFDHHKGEGRMLVCIGHRIPDMQTQKSPPGEGGLVRVMYEANALIQASAKISLLFWEQSDWLGTLPNCSGSIAENALFDQKVSARLMTLLRCQLVRQSKFWLNV